MSDAIALITKKDQLGKMITLLGLDQARLDAFVIGDHALAQEAASLCAAVTWIDSKGEPAENFATQAAAEIAKLGQKAVVAVSAPGSRAVGGKLAHQWDAPIISNAVSVSFAEDAVRIDHALFDNKIVQTVEITGPTVILVDPLALQNDESAESGPAPIQEITSHSDAFVEVQEYVEAETSALQDADIVVSVGRGIGGEDTFNKAEQLCRTLGGEMGCSMPGAKELHLLPLDRYVGISGKRISPKLYIALGISGLPQHVMGVKNSKAIVVVNKDPKAFFFENSDYGIVGDVEEVIPALERAFAAAL